MHAQGGLQNAGLFGLNWARNLAIQDPTRAYDFRFSFPIVEAIYSDSSTDGFPLRCLVR